MKTKGLETYLYSTLGVLAMLAIVIAVNLISARLKTRVDLTAERAYTLSQGTRNILAKLDTPIQVRFYCSQGENRMPVPLKTYAQHVEDLLGEYRQLSKGQIEIIKLDPAPDSDAEDSAKLDEVEGQAIDDNGEMIYLGVSVSMLDHKEVIPFLSPARERLLEYDLSRAISRVATATKPVIGVMSSMSVAGQPMSPMMMQMGRQSQPAWVIYSELQRDFDVKQVEAGADKIPDDVKVLVLIHPRGITDATQYALDQFVLRGGKLIAFLDPMAALDQAGAQMGGNSSSNLETLLKAWGLEFNNTKVVADLSYMGRTRQGRAPAVLGLTEKAMNKDDIITAQADNIFLVFAGAFSGTPAAGLTETVLIKSSKDSQLIDPAAAQGPGDAVVQNFAASGVEYPLAVRLTGTFKTAFPNGKPEASAPKPGDPKAPEIKTASLKESAGASSVVLIGDSDLIQDQVCVQEMQNPLGGGQRMVMPSNGNLAFVQGAIEQLTGDDNLITVRSRASRERPFTVVKKMQNDAEARYRSKIKELEASLTEAQTKLNELQSTKADKGGGKFILSPEQQEEITNFRKKEADVKQQLKVERKSLRADIDSLENRIKWLNIAGMPALVTLVGVGMALVNRQRRAAR